MIISLLELAKIYIRLDEPNSALKIYEKALQKYPEEISFLLSSGRVYDSLNKDLMALDCYKKVLLFESCNFEAVACIATHHFYLDQPEVALRFYKRLVQLGVNSAEI